MIELTVGEMVLFRSKGLVPRDCEVAYAWIGDDHKLHIRMWLDNAFDVVFENPAALRPRSIEPYRPPGSL